MSGVTGGLVECHVIKISRDYFCQCMVSQDTKLQHQPMVGLRWHREMFGRARVVIVNAQSQYRF